MVSKKRSAIRPYEFKISIWHGTGADFNFISNSYLEATLGEKCIPFKFRLE
jgi:hypothetical protein